jgi:hypothetical protein
VDAAPVSVILQPVHHPVHLRPTAGLRKPRCARPQTAAAATTHNNLRQPRETAHHQPVDRCQPHPHHGHELRRCQQPHRHHARERPDHDPRVRRRGALISEIQRPDGVLSTASYGTMPPDCVPPTPRVEYYVLTTTPDESSPASMPLVRSPKASTTPMATSLRPSVRHAPHGRHHHAQCPRCAGPGRERRLINPSGAERRRSQRLCV